MESVALRKISESNEQLNINLGFKSISASIENEHFNVFENDVCTVRNNEFKNVK